MASSLLAASLSPAESERLQPGQLLGLFFCCQWLLLFLRLLYLLLNLSSFLLCEVLVKGGVISSLKEPFHSRLCALEAGGSEGSHSPVITESHVEEGCHHLLCARHVGTLLLLFLTLLGQTSVKKCYQAV